MKGHIATFYLAKKLSPLPSTGCLLVKLRGRKKEKMHAIGLGACPVCLNVEDE